LPKFDEDKIQVETLIEKWIYFIKKAPNLEVIPSNVDDEGLKHAYENANKLNWTRDELLAYDYASMRKADESSKIRRAVEKAVKQEVEKAVKEAVDATVVETVKEFHKNGASVEMIALSFKLPVERVRQILGLGD